MLEDARATPSGGACSSIIETGATASLRALAKERRIAPTLRAGQDVLFRSLWVSNIPIVVKETTDSMQCSWSPQEFVNSHGNELVKMIKTPGTSSENVTVSKFFDEFLKDDDERTYSIKIKVSLVYPSRI